MQLDSRIISLKQLLLSLLIAEIFLLILGLIKVLILVIPFLPVFLYAINLKVNNKEVTFEFFSKLILLATIILFFSLFILLFFDYQVLVKWRRTMGLISAIFFIVILIKCSFIRDTLEIYNNHQNLLLLKQINMLYLLFFGLISILIYNDFLALHSSSTTLIINTRWLAGGVLFISIVLKIMFVIRMKDFSTMDMTYNTPSSKKLEEYKYILLRHFDVNELFLRHELNKYIISQETNIPIIHIDYLFNNYLEVDINYFIAEYRIGYALNLMREKGDVYNLKAISYESGFRSRTTFNKYFKYFTDVLPSEYLNKSKRFIS